LKRLILFAATLSLAACATPALAPAAMDGDLGAPSRSESAYAVAQTAAQVADAIGQAPPATLSRTTIDEKVVRGLYKSFDFALSLIDGARAGGMIVRGTPTALAIRDGILATKAALMAASAAQRASNATTYTAALRDAERALAALQLALVR